MTYHNNKSTKQLIILGNGFDLACKLKSSYFDFFQYHFAEVAKHSWSPVNKIDNLNRDFFVLCHD